MTDKMPDAEAPADRLCINCQHHTTGRDQFTHWCTHPTLVARHGRDMVTGNKFNVGCSLMRSIDCGSAGVFFRAKEEQDPQ